MRALRNPRDWILVLLLLGAGVGCASSRPPQSPDAVAPDAAALAEPAEERDEFDDFYLDDELVAEPDPLEEVNRAIFDFNEGFNRFLLSPVARAYGWAVPDLARRGVRNFFENLNEPAVLVNTLLQLRMRDAGMTLGRFTLNSSLGIAGFVDVASCVGLPHPHADFGQTLSKVGLGSGPYLVLPLLGPSTVRDAIGDLVDRLLRPTVYVLGPGPDIALGTGAGFAAYAEHRELLDELRRSSVDFYAAMRNLYFQNRAAELGELPIQQAPPALDYAAQEEPAEEPGEAAEPSAETGRAAAPPAASPARVGPRGSGSRETPSPPASVPAARSVPAAPEHF